MWHTLPCPSEMKLPLRHQFRHLLTGLCTGAARIGTIIIAHLLAFASAVVAHLHTGLACIAVQGRIMLHKMRCRQTHISAIQQHIDMLIMSMFAASLPARLSRLHTNGVTVQTILDALLHLYLTQGQFWIFLHNSPIFLCYLLQRLCLGQNVCRLDGRPNLILGCL